MIRLECYECDCTDGDGIEVIPPDWDDVTEATEDEKNHPALWGTHFGYCPRCNAENLSKEQD